MCKCMVSCVTGGATDQKDHDHREASVIKKVDSKQILGQRSELNDPVKKRDCDDFNRQNLRDTIGVGSYSTDSSTVFYIALCYFL